MDLSNPPLQMAAFEEAGGIINSIIFFISILTLFFILLFINYHFFTIYIKKKIKKLIFYEIVSLNKARVLLLSM